MTMASQKSQVSSHNRSRHTDSSSHARYQPSCIVTAWSNLIWADTQASSALSVCSSRNSEFGILYPVLQLTEMTCHGVPWLLLPVIAFLTCHRIEHQEIALNLFLLIVADLVVICLIKCIVCRPRPDSNVGAIPASLSCDQFSFPSGHTSRTAILFFVAHMYVQLEGWSMTLFCGWGTLVIISRLFMGRHYPSDVVAGWFIGTVEYWVYLYWFWVPRETVDSFIDPFIGHIFL